MRPSRGLTGVGAIARAARMSGRTLSDLLPVERYTEGSAQFRLQQINQPRFPADIIVGDIEHYDFIRMRFAEAHADKALMGVLHDTITRRSEAEPS